MKKPFTLFSALMVSVYCLAQVPQKMSYQSVIRNTSNVLVANQSIGMRVSILQGSPTGTLIYQETYSPNPQTNINGLVTVEIGGGTPLTGTYTGIDWSVGPYFIKTETDPTGGTNYIAIVGTSQLLSVPYALYSKTAKTSSDAVKVTGNQTIAGDKTFNNKIFVTQEGIGTSTPVLSAALDITSSTQGFLPPRMTYIQKSAIVSPVAGLIVWCSNCIASGELQVYNGTIWTNLIGGAASGPLPIVDSTLTVSSITTGTAISGGSISSDGGATVIARGVCWSTATNPTISLSTKTIDGVGIGSFTSSLTPLYLGTTYYVRAYATNSFGTTYGNQVSFKTLATILTNGLVAYYTFDENANDDSGNGNNGIINGASWVPGKFGSAYRFDGTSTITVNLSAPLNTNGYTGISVSVWCQLSDPSKNSNIISLLDNSLKGFIIANDYSRGFVAYKYSGNSGMFTGAVSASVWYHIVYTLDATNQISNFYLNGVLVGSQTNNSFMPLLTTFYIGYHNSDNLGLCWYMNGSIDDIRVYNRVLSVSEINQLHNFP